MTSAFSPKVYVGVAAAVVMTALPLVITDKFILHNIILVLLFGGMASAWNILGGLAGQHSFGHTAFMGLGAYTSTLLFVHNNISPWLGLLAGVVVVTLFALVISYPALRLRGPFFALSTIAVLEVLKRVAVAWRSLTMGSVGLTVPFKQGLEYMVWRSKVPYYYVALAVLAAIILLTYLIRGSRMGYYLRAIRADEDAAQMLGVNTTRYKVAAVVLSAVLTGMLGTIYAQYMYFIDPESVFSADIALQFALASIVGGLDTVMGPLLGAALITPLNEYLRASLQGLQGLNFFVYGVTLIIVVMLIPRGIIPTVEAWWARRRRLAPVSRKVRREGVGG